MPTLLITRRKQLQQAIVPLLVQVDGQPRGALRTGGRLEIEVAPGLHSVVVANDKTVTFDNTTAQQTWIEIWASPWNGKVQAVLKS